MLPACSDNCPRSSDPAFGANNMPNPAPSTVPVSSPITKLPPPPPSFSKRSYPSAIDPSCNGFRVPRLVSRSRVLVLRVLGPGLLMMRGQQPLERNAQAAQEPDHSTGLRADVPPYSIGRVVDPIDRRADGVIDALGLLPHCRGHALDVVEDRVDARHRRRDVLRLE